MPEKMKLLVLEDDADDARLLKEALKDDRSAVYEMSVFPSMARAEAEAREGEYQAALVDMSLPGAEGVTAIRRLAAAAPRLPLLVLTGRAEASFAAEAALAGAHGYAVKGTLWGEALGSAIRAAVERCRRAELEQLRRRDELQREFIANVSHELRTPVAAIRGFTETLLEGAGEDPRLRAEFLETIDRHAARLQRLVEELLELSVLDAGAEKPEPERVELRPFVARLLEDLGPLAAGRQVACASKVPEGLAVRADPELLSRALVNLCRNAIDYNRPGGRMSVRAAAGKGEAVVSVRDTGIGIPAEEMPLVFQRFYRSARAKKHKEQGTGLGLLISKRIVEAHGGRIWAESRVGKGSTFHLALPLA